MLDTIIDKLQQYVSAIHEGDMLTLEIAPENLLSTCRILYDDPELDFKMLIDVCGVDYLDYGVTHWRTESTTATGFSRAVNPDNNDRVIAWDKPRFASVYHLLSLTNNHRVRLKVYMDDDLKVPSVCEIWQSADWFEREAFDLFGIEYVGHPDLRRILTDYGFKGHPFRKDFPLIGNVELRYDAERKACVYEPVSIQPRVLVPKVIRQDSRYLKAGDEDA